MNTLRYNTYFKGGPDDRVMSGLWIGDQNQTDVVFVSCIFNGVEATFTNCIFIDCVDAPKGANCINCEYIRLPEDVRLEAGYKINGEWQ